jgi:hypothetical protein
MFVSKAGAYWVKCAFQMIDAMAGSWPYPPLLGLDRKPCQGQTLWLIGPFEINKEDKVL